VLHTVVEGGGTSLLIGWKGYANASENFFGGVIDAILQASPVPVLVCRPGEQTDIERVVLSVTRGTSHPAASRVWRSQRGSPSGSPGRPRCRCAS
jgi:hypothetical protein